MYTATNIILISYYAEKHFWAWISITWNREIRIPGFVKQQASVSQRYPSFLCSATHHSNGCFIADMKILAFVSLLIEREINVIGWLGKERKWEQLLFSAGGLLVVVESIFLAIYVPSRCCAHYHNFNLALKLHLSYITLIFCYH